MAPGGQQSLIPGVKPKRTSYANRGMEFESELITMHKFYLNRGLARIEKNYCQSQPVKDGQWAKVIGRAIVDFTGLLNGGRFVAFDAKDCVEHRIELNRLASHQEQYLLDVHALGGIAFILVRFRGKDVFRIPVDVWHDAVMWHDFQRPICRADGWKMRNKSSLTVEDLKPEWKCYGCDWLGVK